MNGAQSLSLGTPSTSMSGSQASPEPSPSRSACVGFEVSGQLSRVSQTPSLSASTSVCRHPEERSQESSVHGSPSSQLRVAPARQRPPLHESFAVQALPSLQGAVLSAWRHPEAGLQESSVQGFRSSQSRDGPPVQFPSRHASDVVQALASLHAPAFGAWTQPTSTSWRTSMALSMTPPTRSGSIPGLQESSVQGFRSSQSMTDPAQIPPVQTSFAVQALPSSHGVRSGFGGFEHSPVRGSHTPAS